MRSRIIDIRDVMKLMGVVDFASAPGWEASNLLLFFPISIGTWQPGSTIL